MLRFCQKLFLLTTICFSAIAIEGQNERAEKSRFFPGPNERITPESEFKYYDLISYVYPDAKSTAKYVYDPQKSDASRSIALRKLDGAGFSKINGQPQHVFITHTRWLRARNKREYLVVLFSTVPLDDPKRSRDKLKTAYALAVFRYVHRKVPDWNVFNSLGYKWAYEFDLLDAVDPQIAGSVEFSTELPLIRNEYGDETFWLVNARWDGNVRIEHYNAVELRNNRLNNLFQNFPVIRNSRCLPRLDENFEIVSRVDLPKTFLPFEVRVITKTWTNNECRSRTSNEDLRETRIYLPRMKTLPGKRRAAVLELTEKRAEKIGGIGSPDKVRVPDYD